MKLEKRPNIKVELFPAEEWGKGARVMRARSKFISVADQKRLVFQRKRAATRLLDVG
jgi:hypothetical protein